MTAAAPSAALVVPRNDPAILGYREQAQEIARMVDALVIDSEAAKAEAVELAARISRLQLRPANGRALPGGAEAAAAVARAAVAVAEATGQTPAVESARLVAAGETAAAEQLLGSAIAHEAAAMAAQAQAILPSRTIQTASGTASVRKEWTFELVTLDLVPTDYVVLNEAKVRQAIREGVRDISGLRIFQDVNLSVRRHG